MKKVIALFGGIFLSLLAVLNVHAMTDTTIIESPTFDVMSVNIDTDISDEQLLPEIVLSELETENDKENSKIWQHVVELHEAETADRHTTYIKEQTELREAALAAIELKENELDTEVIENTHNETTDTTYETSDVTYETNNTTQTQVEYQQPVEQVQYEQPKQQIQYQEPVQEVQQTPPPQQTSLNWSALAQCESGGNASIVSANGLYHGLYQFNVETWQSVGGSGLPSNASASEQTMRAQILYDMRGSQPWPQCGGLLFS